MIMAWIRTATERHGYKIPKYVFSNFQNYSGNFRLRYKSPDLVSNIRSSMFDVQRSKFTRVYEVSL